MAELRWTRDELFFLASKNFCLSCCKDCNECGLCDFIGFLKKADGRADNGEREAEAAPGGDVDA